MYEITGQLFFRDARQTRDGKKLYMVVGILALPDGVVKPEHQHTVAGHIDWSGHPGCELRVLGYGATDLTDTAAGFNAGQLLTEPIWRV